MNVIKETVRSLTPPILWEQARKLKRYSEFRRLSLICLTGHSDEKQLARFRRTERIPWSPGYHIYRRQLIAETLATEHLLELFRSGKPLPPAFGHGVDERCVEYPWLFSHLSADVKHILDAGSVLNHDFILKQSLFNGTTLHILTLAPETTCFWYKGISYLYDDLRSIPIRDSYYDAIVCLSTLEHVGCDNTLFTRDNAHREQKPGDFELVMQELRRVLKPGGSLFLSVPFGAYRHFGCFQQFDRNVLSRAIEAFGEVTRSVESFYRYDARGWQVAKESECAECRYVEWIANAWVNHKFPSRIPAEPDLAAAARSVACVQLVKPANSR